MSEFRAITGPLLQQYVENDSNIKITQVKLITEILKRLNNNGFLLIEPKFSVFIDLLK